MTPNTWEKVKDIFSAAVAVEPGARVGKLDEICGSDDRLRAEVEALLRSNEAVQGFIEEPAFRVSDVIRSDAAATARSIGPYRIEREIGRGGMGTVYLARREDGEFQQQVAIKIVSSTLLGSEALRRFRQERQILAGMNHPNVARLLDGGVTDEGVSYLVMEYVEGEPLLDFAENNNLSLDERLRLFLKICRALAYAHRNLIVHRDIKPSNILVNPDGEPKLLDFGLAKILDIDNDKTRTATNFRALTPAYASPEQLRGDPITTASDIYSLGIVLYELVAGTRPFGNQSATYEKMVYLVSVAEPERPSTTAASARFRTALKGDVDNIVLTSIRKEPERRYRSVELFADDIERHLTGLPVTAAEDTFLYRSTKFIRRHRIGAVSVAVIAVVLIAGIVTTSWQARRARREQALAEATKSFLTRTLNYSNPMRTGRDSKETTVTDVLDEAARRLDSEEFADQPEIRAELEFVIGKAYFGQGKNPLAMQHIERYVDLERSRYGDEHPKTLIALSEWAGLLFYRGDLEPARQAYAQILPAMRKNVAAGDMPADSLANALNIYACVRRTQGDPHEAEMLFREALELSPQLNEDDRRLINGTTRSTLASALSDQGRFEEALEESRKAVDEAIAIGATDEPNYGFALTVLGGFLTEAGRYEEADEALRQGDAVIRKFLSPAGLWMGDNLRNQAILAFQKGDYAEALSRSEEAMAIYRDAFGTHYDHYPTAMIVHGSSLAKMGNVKEGEAELREALRMRSETLPPKHYWVAIAKGALGECLAAEGRYGEAEPLLTQSYESLKDSQGDRNPRTEAARQRLNVLYQQIQRPDLIAKHILQ